MFGSVCLVALRGAKTSMFDEWFKCDVKEGQVELLCIVVETKWCVRIKYLFLGVRRYVIIWFDVVFVVCDFWIRTV